MNFHQWNISRKRRLTYFNRKKKGSTNSIREKTKRFINFIINLIKRAIKNEAKLTEKFISSNHSSSMLITKNVNFQFHDFHKNRRINFTRHFFEARNWNTTEQKKRRERTFMKKFSTILVYKGKRMFQVSLFRDFSRKRVFAQLAWNF